MSNSLVFWLCIVVSVLGVVVTGGAAWFGYRMFHQKFLLANNELFEMLHFHKHCQDYNSREIRMLTQQSAAVYAEYLQRRNEYWMSYGQVLLAILIVVILSILLLTKAISAEAGLPILSGISGFAIAKGVNNSGSLNLPTNDRQE